MPDTWVKESCTRNTKQPLEAPLGERRDKSPGCEDKQQPGFILLREGFWALDVRGPRGLLVLHSRSPCAAALPGERPQSEVGSNQEGGRKKPVPQQVGCAQTPTTIPSPACRLPGWESNHWTNKSGQAGPASLAERDTRCQCSFKPALGSGLHGSVILTQLQFQPSSCCWRKTITVYPEKAKLRIQEATACPQAPAPGSGPFPP